MDNLKDNISKRRSQLSPEKQALLAKRLRREQVETAPASVIPRRPLDQPVPLSFAQQRLWFLNQLAPNNPFYNEPLPVRLVGPLDIGVLEQTLNALIRRHEGLRTTFQVIDGQTRQVIAPELQLSIPVLDLSAVPAAERDAALRQAAGDLIRQPFDLARGPLLRTALLRLAPDDHVLLTTLHHIICDGWSLSIFNREMALIYQALSSGQQPDLPPIPAQYADFAYWQRQWLQGEVLDQQLGYWKRQLADLPELAFPTDRPRPLTPSFAGGRRTLVLPRQLAHALNELSQREGISLFMTLLAGFKVLLGRYTSQDDIVVGFPIANRNHADLEKIIGFFANTLILRTDLSGNPTFRELLGRVRSVAVEAYSHQDLPFERLVEELQPERELGRNPLFQYGFVLHNALAPVQSFAGLTIHPVELSAQTAKLDLLLFMKHNGDDLIADAEYSTDLFDDDTIARLLEHFQTVLTSAVANPDTRIDRLPLLSDVEQHQLLIDWNASTRDYPAERAMHQLFETQAARTPDAIATSFENQTLSYGELNRRSNQLAHHLQVLGVRDEMPVGICVERSLDMLIGVLGILKAGGAYLPLDAAYPAERLQFMLADSRAPILVTQQRLIAELPEHSAHIVCLDRDGESIATQPEHNPEIAIDPEQLAYMIYTSGSTGQPKGVQISQRALVNFLTTMAAQPGLSDRDTLLAVTTLSFDIAALELWLPLITGGRVVLASRETAADSVRLQELLLSTHATIMQATPATWRMLLASDWPGQPDLRILCGGEALPRELADQLLSRCAELWNMYGPTETTVWSTVERVTAERSLSIGRPIGNTQVYVLDRRLQPVPIGVPGMLYIGGDGLARGYLNRPDLTAERFIPDPFGAPGARLYNTGDLVRWRADGRLEHLGRADYQVKVRGFRIELGEIETVLQQHPEVAETVVIVRDDATPDEQPDQQIVAYVVPRPPEQRAASQRSDGELQHEQLAQWQMVWNDVYTQETPPDPTFNISGWRSSYTGQPIPELEMREWVDQTVQRILELRPRRVLEIGVGTGLLMWRIAPHCQRYVGTDFSGTAVRLLQEQLATQATDWSQVTLLERAANDWSGIDADSFDLVIINSVAQYFPGIHYLLTVLQQAAQAVRPGGAIFVGDVRSLPHLELFHTAIQSYQAAATLPIQQLRQQIQKHLHQEAEMTIDPAFFSALADEQPRLNDARIYLKRGRAHNELTRFRYDAILHVGPAAPAVALPWRDWQGESLTLRSLRRELVETQPPLLGLTHVPNSRLLTDAQTQELIAGLDSSATVGTLRDALAAATPAGIDPEDLWALGQDTGYSVEITWADPATPEYFAVVLRREPAAAIDRWNAPVVPPSRIETRRRTWSAYANNPLHGQSARKLVPQLRAFVQEKLPAYMLPSAFVLLDALPLTANNKIDRRALPAPERERGVLAAEYVPPRTPTEEILASIWSAVLGVAQVGIHDDFFALGGHSLSATQFVARVRDVFHLELPLRALFEAPTIALLSSQIDAGYGRDKRSPAPPLAPMPRTENLPLSFAQQRLWFLDQLIPNSPFYNLPIAVRLTGWLDLALLEDSFNECMRRHESLRTTFAGYPQGAAPGVDGQPIQVIAPELSLPLPIVDLQALSETEQEAQVRQLSAEEARRPFDLTRGPLVRVTLLRLDPTEHVLLLTMHHIISDGWSLGVFVNELATLYGDRAADRDSALPELPVQYADFALWQRAWLSGGVLATQIDYWKQQLADLPVLDLPTDRPRPAIQSFRGAAQRFTLPAPLTQSLKTLSQREGVTLFMTLLAGFQTLLSRYSGQPDIAVGSPIANRTHAALEGLIGFFVNTLVLRTDLSGAASVHDALRRVRDVCLQAYAHQDVPFEMLVDELQPERDMSRNPLFQVMFVLQNTPLPAIELPGLSLSQIPASSATAKFDLWLSMTEGDEELFGTLEYNTDLFDDATIARLLGHFETLLQSFVAQPTQPLLDLPILTATEQQQQTAWNATEVAYDLDRCLHELIEAQARRTPDAVALVCPAIDESDGPEQRLSYGELDRRANQLAQHLRGLGVRGCPQGEVPVGICVERSLELVIGLLAILKAGGYYVPLDPSYPRDRLGFLIENAQVPVLLTQRHLDERLPAERLSLDTQRVYLDGAWAFVDQPATPPATALTPDNLAYMIYTSGSTGQPKGAMNSHRAIVNRLLWMQDAYQLCSDDRVLQKTPFSFDVSVWEFFWPLLTGATLVIARPDGHKDPAYLVRLIAAQQITTLHFVPSMLQPLLDEPDVARCQSLRRVICSGEALPYALQERFFERLDAELHNLYGPTEAAVDVTWWHCQPDSGRQIVPIGHPIANTQLYVLDRQLNPVPIGVPGELYISGVQLARGYYNRPDLTAERFIADPLSEIPGGRLYRTGDLARFLPDGAIEYLGRIDHQVKLRGFRIELGEIEAVLSTHPAVREGVAAIRTDRPNDPRLIAYVVPVPGRPVTATELRRHLRQRLPEHMIPQ
ncbi:MAG: amino acid adenylation domain-containing protein, partial [Chloroflexi bacterium]|nr:amino acid adenylation domain-containing protein [Chloroflexota bacterium]